MVKDKNDTPTDTNAKTPKKQDKDMSMWIERYYEVYHSKEHKDQCVWKFDYPPGTNTILHIAVISVPPPLHFPCPKWYLTCGYGLGAMPGKSKESNEKTYDPVIFARLTDAKPSKDKSVKVNSVSMKHIFQRGKFGFRILVGNMSEKEPEPEPKSEKS